jgi:hypothetical protein
MSDIPPEDPIARAREQTRAHLAREKVELAELEAKVADLAQQNIGPVMLAMMRGLVEMVCGRDGAVFRDHNKVGFYRGVLALLASKGIT